MAEGAYRERPTEPNPEQFIGVNLYNLRTEQKSTTLFDARSKRAEALPQPKTLEEAIDIYTGYILEANPVTARRIDEIFAIPSSRVTSQQIKYFSEYAAIAIKELVRGAVAILLQKQEYKEDQIIGYLASGAYLGNLFTDFLIFHDVMHTVAQLGTVNGKTIKDMRPPFQAHALKGSSTDPREAERERRSLIRDEAFALLWFRVTHNTDTQRERLLAVIDRSKNEQDFVVQYFEYMSYAFYNLKQPEHVDEISPFMRKTLGRVYREYANNPQLLFDIFKEITTPLMKAEAAKKEKPKPKKKWF